MFEDRRELAQARMAEDVRLKRVIGSYTADDLGRVVSYRTMAEKPQKQALQEILLHLFNHQTHHRGQAHACCSILTRTEPPGLDLLLFQRGVPAPSLSF